MITGAQNAALLAALDSFLAAQQRVGERFIGNAYAHGRDAIAALSGAKPIEQMLEASRIASLVDSNFELIVSTGGKWIREIQDIVSQGYLQGESPVDIAKHVSGYFNRMHGNWKVIARDQVAKAQQAGRNTTYEQIGQQRVEVTCAPDACELCLPHDGEVVAVYDTTSRPQFHIQCACMDVPVVDDEGERLELSAKDYDPDQPRDDEGRWTDTGGGLDLDEFALPDTSTLSNAPFDPDKVDSWLEKYGDKAEAWKSFAEHWSDFGVDASKITAEAKSGSTKRGRYLAKALDNAPVQRQAMHRGVNFPKKLKEGDLVKLDPSSFSLNKEVAVGYAESADNPVVFTLATAAQARALPIGALSSFDANEQELISGGTFRVGLRAVQKGGYVQYYLKRAS